MKIDELTKWVMSVDRRLLVMKEIHENELIKASEIAETTGRSLQNISRAIRELEEYGLIECLTPEKHTWKRYILTEKGVKIFEKFKKNIYIINYKILKKRSVKDEVAEILAIDHNHMPRT